MPKFTAKTIVAVGIGAALFFVLGRFASIMVFTNTYLTFQYAVLVFFAVLFGPIAGLLIGLIGHVLIDLTLGYGLWWSWIIVSVLIGFAFGFIMKGVNIEEGEFVKAKSIVRFIVGVVAVHLVGWGLIAPALDVLIYAEPTEKIITQGLIAGSLNAATTAIIGTILLVIYSRTRTKTGSLTKE